MKILHTADWHLGAYVGPQCDDPMKRMENTMKCLHALLETAWKEQPDIILVCGDIFHQARVWSDRALTEVAVASTYLNRLGEIAPVVVLYGTPNHDGRSQFSILSELTKNVEYFVAPGITIVPTKSGDIQVAGLPGFDKGHFRAQFPGMSAEEENKVFSQELANIVAGLSAQVDPNIPSVLMAHHTVVGAELDNGEHLFQANEVVLPAAALDASAFNLVCLGHIHKAQEVANCYKPVFYAGSIDAFTFNDEGHRKGFWIHELGTFQSPITYEHRFIEMPAREFKTERWDSGLISIYQKEGLITRCIDEDEYRDKVVRVLYICDVETEKAFNKKKLEQDLYAAGAYYVTEIRPEKVTASVNQNAFHEKMTVESCLQRYLDEKNVEPEKVVQLLETVSGIIAEAQASMPMGTASGLFLPVEISVRNYRSYVEETFNFQDIYFAMVNGKNGSGKSSLFMDAITDCLYEKTRENELTGWIRNDEKSGSISFTFQLGNNLWRVTRTRQRSGKGTLALAKREFAFSDYGEGTKGDSGYVWVDHSCDRMTDTQQKIIDLLGMDCDTFQSCVLIMQDQYGKFMEADKSERMAVLANLLGLGIYDELLKLTKEKLTDVNREIRASKEEIAELENEVAGEEDLHAERRMAEVELHVAQDDLAVAKNKLSEIQEKLGAIAGYEEEARRLQNELKDITDAYTAKKQKRDDLQRRVEETKSFLQNEQNILEKYAELKQARLDLAALDGKLQLLADKRIRHSRLDQELIEMRRSRQIAMDRLNTIELRLEEQDQLRKTIESLSDAEDALEEYELKAARQKELDNQLSNIQIMMNNLEKQTEMLKDSGCIDIDKAQCKFLQSAKAASTALEELDKKANDLINELVELDYNSHDHVSAINNVKAYRAAKEKLAQLAVDAAAAEQLRIQEAEQLKRIQTIEAELAALEPEIHELEAQTGKAAELKAKISELARFERLEGEIPKAKQFVESTEGAIGQLNADIEDLHKRCDQIIDRLNDLAAITANKEDLTNEKRQAEAFVQTVEKSISDLNQRIGRINAELLAIEAKKLKLLEKQEQLRVTAGQAANLEILAQAFSQDGIPYQIIRDIVPELEAAANEILSQMTGGRMRLEFVTEKTLKSNKAKEVATLDIIINDVDNGVLPYLSRSGGQKVRAALAVSFALAMIKASRVGLQLGMMFVDEPPFLDAEGVDAYCAALAAIHERYPEMRILAISHDENMKNHFPQQIYVEQTENGSRVKRL